MQKYINLKLTNIYLQKWFKNLSINQRFNNSWSNNYKLLSTIVTHYKIILNINTE